MSPAIVYAGLPKIQCKRKCQQACGPIVISDVEQRAIESRTGKPFTIFTSADLTCELLEPITGACSVYPIRPLICRLWGLVKEMRCPWGCQPERWVTDAEARRMLAELEEMP